MTVTTAFQQVAVWMQTRLVRGQRGSSLVEYALLITLIAVVCLLALNQFGQTTEDSYSQFATSLAAAG
ncbi:MAG: Flp family type IVb pilin [Acidimicrobiales bacterium]